MLGTGVTNGVFGDVVHSLWDAIGSITGLVGLSQLAAIGVVLFLLLLAVAFQIYGAVTGRQSWSLDDEPAVGE